MSYIKRYLEDQQQKYAWNKFIKDGCPPEEAVKENWDSMVEAFFDGDHEAAYDEFVASTEDGSQGSIV